jgi:hypothetical protein
MIRPGWQEFLSERQVKLERTVKITLVKYPSGGVGAGNEAPTLSKKLRAFGALRILYRLGANRTTNANMLSLCCEFLKPAQGRWFRRFG